MSPKSSARCLAGRALILLAVIYPAVLAQASENAEQIQSPPPADVSYALGYNLGMALNSQNTQTELEEIIQGLKDALARREGRIPANEVAGVLTDFYSLDRRRAKATESAQNKEAGERFLAQNARRHGVIVLPSGLQYEVLTSGEGPSPGADSTVLIHQLGKRLDGFVITDTYERGFPDEIQANVLLPGVAEALQHMSPGDHWKLYIPAELGFGVEGRPPLARGPVVLVWELELISIGEEAG